MHRIVRDMCKKLGKQVKLTLVGEDTEVDKTIVDSISDPIMHIVRTLWTTGSRRPLRIGSMPERTRWVRSSSPHGTPEARSSLRSG